MAWNNYRLYTDEELGDYANPYPALDLDDMGSYKNPIQTIQQLAGFQDSYDDAASVYADMVRQQRTPRGWSGVNQQFQAPPLSNPAQYQPNPWEMARFRTLFENMQKRRDQDENARLMARDVAERKSWEIPKGQPGYRQGPTSVSGGFPGVSYGAFRHRVNPETGLPEEVQDRFDRPFGKPSPSYNYIEQGPEGPELFMSDDTIEPSYRTASVANPRLLQLTGPNAEKFETPRSWLPRPFSGGVMDPKAQAQADAERRAMEGALNKEIVGRRDLIHNKTSEYGEPALSKRAAQVQARTESEIEQLKGVLAQIKGVEYPYKSPKEREKDAEVRITGAKDDVQTLTTKLKDVKNEDGTIKYGPKQLAQIGRDWALNIDKLPEDVKADISKHAGPEWLRQYRTGLPPQRPFPPAPMSGQAEAPPQPAPPAQPSFGSQALGFIGGLGKALGGFLPLQMGLPQMAGEYAGKKTREMIAPYAPDWSTPGGPGTLKGDIQQAGRNLGQMPTDLRALIPILRKLYLMQYGLSNR